MTGIRDAAPTIHLSSAHLTFDQTVPRGLVHRAALSEVYVADSMQTSDDEYVLSVQVPRAHCVWFDRRVPYHDPLATGEAARQGVYVVVHRHLGIPAELTFSLRGLELQVTDLECYRDCGTAPLQGLLTLRLVERRDHDGRFGAMTFIGGVAIEGRVAMTLRGELAFFSREDHAALREFQRRRTRTRPTRSSICRLALPPEAVGRRDQRNCLLAAPTEPGKPRGELRFPVLVDQHHPCYFDHAYDHVPGPLIIEAYRQAAVVTAHRCEALETPLAAVVGCRAAFSDFAELDVDLECAAAFRAPAGPGPIAVDVRLLQFGRAISLGSVELAPYPAGTRLN